MSSAKTQKQTHADPVASRPIQWLPHPLRNVTRIVPTIDASPRSPFLSRLAADPRFLVYKCDLSVPGSARLAATKIAALSPFSGAHYVDIDLLALDLPAESGEVCVAGVMVHRRPAAWCDPQADSGQDGLARRGFLRRTVPFLELLGPGAVGMSVLARLLFSCSDDTARQQEHIRSSLRPYVYADFFPCYSDYFFISLPIFS